MKVTDEDYPNKVLLGLNDLRERAELTDVVLDVEGRSFPCHRAILASCSPYFRSMFTSGYAEAKQERICIQDVSEVAMATILDYAYTGCLQTEPDQVQSVMSAAGLFQVGFVCCKAAEYMRDLLDVSNCVDVLMYADMQGNQALLESSKRYIASRFNQVALQPSFLQLPLPLLKSLLDRDDLMTNSENDVVQAALRWIEFDKERLEHLPVLCTSFRCASLKRKLRKGLESKVSTTDCKLVYSDSTVERLGQKRTKMLIFLKADYQGAISMPSTPCYDPSRFKINFSMTVTPDNELYLAGHIDGVRNGEKVSEKAFYQYNPLLNTWESRCEMISPKNGCSLVYLNGYIYAIAGTRGSTVERYDPSCDKWMSVPSLPSSTCSFCAVPLDNNIYVISDSGCFCFSTIENTWKKIRGTLIHSMHIMNYQGVEYEGRIYCVYWSGVFSSSVQMYNPKDGKWSFAGKVESFSCDYAMLMVYKRSYGKRLYLITVRSMKDPYDYSLESPGSKWPRIDLYEYKKSNDSWSKEDSEDKMVPPMVKWLGEAGKWTKCLVARMVPTSLEDGSSYEDDEEDYDYMYGDESDNYLSSDCRTTVTVRMTCLRKRVLIVMKTGRVGVKMGTIEPPDVSKGHRYESDNYLSSDSFESGLSDYSDSEDDLTDEESIDSAEDREGGSEDGDS
ncbi:kelch repeat and BTB domain-containing protein 8-like isoform X2 [Branchiostoma floridae x Branchiostoma japonicum]